MRRGLFSTTFIFVIVLRSSGGVNSGRAVSDVAGRDLFDFGDVGLPFRKKGFLEPGGF